MALERMRPNEDMGVVVPNEAFEIDPGLKDYLQQIAQRIGRDLKAHLPQD